jgi:hypothetical protein
MTTSSLASPLAAGVVVALLNIVDSLARGSCLLLCSIGRVTPGAAVSEGETSSTYESVKEGPKVRGPPNAHAPCSQNPMVVATRRKGWVRSPGSVFAYSIFEAEGTRPMHRGRTYLVRTRTAARTHAHARTQPTNQRSNCPTVRRPSSARSLVSGTFPIDESTTSRQGSRPSSCQPPAVSLISPPPSHPPDHAASAERSRAARVTWSVVRGPRVSLFYESLSPPPTAPGLGRSSDPPKHGSEAPAAWLEA